MKIRRLHQKLDLIKKAVRCITVDIYVICSMHTLAAIVDQIFWYTGLMDSKRKRRFEIKSSSIFNSPNGTPSTQKDRQKLNLFNKKLKHSLDHHNFTPVTTAEAKAKFHKTAVEGAASSLVKRKSESTVDSNKIDCQTVNSLTEDDSLTVKQNRPLNALVGYESDTDSDSSQENR